MIILEKQMGGGVKTEYEVYADLLFLINFSMDFLCLFLTSKILHRRLRPAYTVGAAFLGGIYSVISLFADRGKFISISSDITICLIMCFMAFARRGRTLRQFVYEFLVYLSCSAALGGIMTALFNFLNRFDLPLNSGGNDISPWLFLLLSLISGAVALKSGGFLARLPSEIHVDTEIILGEKSVLLSAISDSGNLLRDSIGGRPVIIADIKAMLPVLPTTICKAITEGNIGLLSSLPPELSRRIRIISGSTVSGSKLLVGIIPDKVLIHLKKETREVSAIFAPALLTSLPNGYNAILPAELTK